MAGTSEAHGEHVPNGFTESDFDAFARDVAARVIQHYYRQWMRARRQQRRDVDVSARARQLCPTPAHDDIRVDAHVLPTLQADVKTFASSGGSSASGRYMNVTESVDHERHDVREDGGGRGAQDRVDDKLQSIIAFLDEVEDNTERQRQKGTSSRSTAVSRVVGASTASAPSSVDRASVGADVSADASADGASSNVLKENNGRSGESRALMAASDAPGTHRGDALVRGVKSKVETLKSELEAARARIMSLERDREQLTGAAEMERNEQVRCATARVEALKAENEAAIRRHLDFIDRLLADKDELSRALALSATESKAIETRHEEKLRALQRDWSRELSSQRDAWQRGEKARRDEWTRSKTKEIKEMTVRGLEPEIQRLMQRHRADVADLEARHHAAMKQRQDEASLQHESYVRALRERMLHERQDELEAERMKGAARMREMSDAHDAAIARQRSVFAEKDRERTESHERAVRLLQEGHMEEMEKTRSDCESRIAKQESETRDAADAMEASMRETLDAERALLEQKLRAQMDARIAETEKALTEEYTKKATEEVAAVVARLEEDSAGAKTDFDARIAQREAELARRHEQMLMAASEKARRMQDRYETCQRELVTAEGRSGEAHLRLAELERQLEDSRRRCTEAERSAEVADDGSASLRSQLDALQAVLADREAADSGFAREAELRIEALTSEVARLRAVGESQAARHRLEMEDVDSRVRKLVAHKDDVIARLQAQMEDLEGSLA